MVILRWPVLLLTLVVATSVWRGITLSNDYGAPSVPCSTLHSGEARQVATATPTPATPLPPPPSPLPQPNTEEAVPGGDIAYISDTTAGWVERFRFRNIMVSHSNHGKQSTATLQRTLQKELFQKYWEPTVSCPFPVKHPTKPIWLCNVDALRERPGRVSVVAVANPRDSVEFAEYVGQLFGEKVDVHHYYLPRPNEPPTQPPPNQAAFLDISEASNLHRLEEHLRTTPVDILYVNVTKASDSSTPGEEIALFDRLFASGEGCPLRVDTLVMRNFGERASVDYTRLFTRLTHVCPLEIFMKDPIIRRKGWTHHLMWGMVRVDWAKAVGPFYSVSPELAYMPAEASSLRQAKAYRNTMHAKFNTIERGKEGANPYEFFNEHWQPTFQCPIPLRMGRVGDGGKWVCNPAGMLAHAIRENRQLVVYSLGSNSEYSFEESVKSYFKEYVEVHSFDRATPRVPPPEFLHFHHWEVVPSESDINPAKAKYTFKRITEILKHKHIDILKMDIEYGEYPIFEAALSNGRCDIPTNMLLVEVHKPPPWKFNKHFQRLTDCGFEMYMKEPNIEAAKGNVMEWSLVKMNWSLVL